MYRQHLSIVFRLCTFFSMTNVCLRCGFISTHCSDVSNILTDFSMALTLVTVDVRPERRTINNSLTASFDILTHSWVSLTHRTVYLLKCNASPEIHYFRHPLITQIGLQAVVVLWCTILNILSLLADVLLYWYVPFSEILVCEIFWNTSMCHFLKYWCVPFFEICRRLAVLVCAILWNTGMCSFFKSAEVLLYWYGPLS